MAILGACNAVKRVDDGEYLLTENTIFEDGEKISNKVAYNQLYQKPNIELLGIPMRLHIYNLAKPHPDSAFTRWVNKKPGRKENLIDFLSEKQLYRLGESYEGLNNIIKDAGQPPTILEKKLTQESADRLKAYYYNNGWFNAETDFEIKKEENKRATVDYFVIPKKPYIIDSLEAKIASKDADSIYQRTKWNSFVKSGDQFKTLNFNKERQRITQLFRNSGLYYFEQEYISYIADTVNTGHKVNVDLVIKDRDISENDSIKTIPFKVKTISEVNIVTDYSYKKRDEPILHDTIYNNFHLYSFDELDYKPKAITSSVFIKKGDVYKDKNRALTYNRLNGLGVFKYPDIEYIDDPRDSTNTKLIANIFLSPKEKFGLSYNLEAFRSNIQDFGIGFGTSFLIRNVFGGAEILELAARGSIGSSKDAAENEDVFFNISEIGADLKLTFPKIAFPINVEKIIPKYMSPFTTMRVGLSKQTNIGLDKQNFTAAYTYKWEPSEILGHQLDLINVQYVRNLNVENYFNVYRNSFDELNRIALNNIDQIPATYFNGENTELTIPDGVNNFISDIKNQGNLGLDNEEQQEANSIIERKDRLTENNLIVASNFTYLKNTKRNLYDLEYTQFRGKIEFAGNTLSLLSPMLGLEKNENDNYDLFGVQFSQYAKLELSLIKHWYLGQQTTVAVRLFGGVALPYGNSNSIPFSRSFFAGGANDNRGWQAYDLGPGSTGGVNEFNEANLKLAFNAEYRFNLFGDLFSAVFVDVGNIWHVLDNVEEEAATFTSFSDLSDLAIGSGFGLRYDLDFFVIRLDLGFKTYAPANDDQKWFRDYNFKNVVYNIGINYPF